MAELEKQPFAGSIFDHSMEKRYALRPKRAINSISCLYSRLKRFWYMVN